MLYIYIYARRSDDISIEHNFFDCIFWKITVLSLYLAIILISSGRLAYIVYFIFIVLLYSTHTHMCVYILYHLWLGFLFLLMTVSVCIVNKNAQYVYLVSHKIFLQYFLVILK